MRTNGKVVAFVKSRREKFLHPNLPFRKKRGQKRKVPNS